MATIKQKRVAHRIVKSAHSKVPLTAGEILLEAGYSDIRAKSPAKVINSPGVQEELEKLGFTEGKAKKVVGMILSDIDEKAEARLKAADMVFKAFGTYAPEKSISLNMNYTPDPKTVALANEYEEKLKGKLE